MAHPAERTTEAVAFAEPDTPRMLRPEPAAWAEAAPAGRFDQADAALVDLLRDLARESRLSCRLDVDRACALIATEPGDAVRRYGLALLSALGDGATVRLVFHVPGSPERSFAERWLAGLVASVLRDDADSVRFAVERVVAPRHRRSVRFLVRGFAGAWGSLERA